MVEIDGNQYKGLCEAYDKVCKRVEVYKSRALTKNSNKKTEYKIDLVKTYNDLLGFINTIYDSLSTESKIEAQTKIVTYLKRLKECFQIIGLEYEFGNQIHALITVDNVIETWNSETKTDSDSSASSSSTVINTTNSSSKNTQGKTIDKQKNPTNQLDNRSRTSSLSSENSQDIDSSSSSSDEENDMPQTKNKLMQIAASTINYKYDGDASKLDSFIDAIELLKEVCEEQNEAILLKFIMTKLEGKAREAIIKQPENCDDIINQLKAVIKAESSKVVEGRMLALRADKTNLTKFSERAEELAEQYRRSLCDEGIPKEKAKQLAVEKTIELCRKNTRSDRVDSIIASKEFSEPKDVIAKMIVEINNLKLLRNSSQYTHSNKNNNHKNGNHSNNKFQRNHNGNSNSNSNNNRYGNNNRQNGNNYKPNWNGNGNRNGQQNSNSRTYTNSNFRRTNEQPVRLMAGNEMIPGNGGQSSEQHQ